MKCGRSHACAKSFAQVHQPSGCEGISQHLTLNVGACHEYGRGRVHACTASLKLQGAAIDPTMTVMASQHTPRVPYAIPLSLAVTRDMVLTAFAVAIQDLADALIHSREGMTVHGHT